MPVLSLVTGILGVLAVPCVLVAHSLLPLLLGLALSLVAIVVGVISRKTKEGKAGLVLGGLTIVLSLAMIMMLTARTGSAVAAPAVTAVPAK